ncbi:hypothetical protein Mapa_013217 [Marchantia paleacea]|nr:hypothetical protein Mapa_013217 [Marchantia paleacea]
MLFPFGTDAYHTLYPHHFWTFSIPGVVVVTRLNTFFLSSSFIRRVQNRLDWSIKKPWFSNPMEISTNTRPKSSSSSLQSWWLIIT